MKKLGGGMILALLAVSLIGCTQQQRAKYAGGNATVELPPGMKLVNATWKEDSLWCLIRPMRDDERQESYSFIESSSFGMLEGRVFIIEKK